MAAKKVCGLWCCNTTPAAIEKIREDIAVWQAGRWAELVAYGPGCLCTVRGAYSGCPLHPTETRETDDKDTSGDPPGSSRDHPA